MCNGISRLPALLTWQQQKKKVSLKDNSENGSSTYSYKIYKIKIGYLGDSKSNVYRYGSMHTIFIH